MGNVLGVRLAGGERLGAVAMEEDEAVETAARTAAEVAEAEAEAEAETPDDGLPPALDSLMLPCMSSVALSTERARSGDRSDAVEVEAEE